MSDGSVQRITRQSWGGRLKGAVSGVIVGAAFIAGSCILLFWNEGRAVRRSQALSEGAAAVLSVSASSIGIDNQDRLVHVQGEARADAPVEDSELGVSAPGLALVRQVEMYQWVEEKHSEERKKLGGGTETVTTYTYDHAWRDEPVDSSRFEQPDGHDNPPWRLRGERFDAASVQLGAFRLSDAVAGKIGGLQDLAVDAAVAGRAASVLGREVAVVSGGLFAGRDHANPAVGDVRIEYRFVPYKTVSVVARQDGDRLDTYTTTNGGRIVLVEDGEVPAVDMFASARRGNTVATWLVRLLGFVVSWIGFGLLLRPLRVLSDVVPLVGTVVGAGLGLVSLLIGSALSLAVMALGWIVYRPIVGIGLLVLVAALVILLVRRALKARAKARQAAAAATTPTPELPPLPGSEG